MLWIAFIFEYLWDTTQQRLEYYWWRCCCELLSFLSIFGIQHNNRLRQDQPRKVVNCFHFWVSLGYNTTNCSKEIVSIMLWIAFIFEYLWDTTQPMVYYPTDLVGCELLSFLSIFGIQHNFCLYPSIRKSVVNCFHFWVSLGYNTTVYAYGYMLHRLWIAFIFEYLWDTTQPRTIWLCRLHCCELLSFLSIFGIQHNFLQNHL